MPPKVKRYKMMAVKKSLLKGKSYKETMLDNGYSERTANNGKDVPVIQEALNEIERELKANEVTIEFVIKRLNEDRALAINKQDYATATRVDELLGKYLAMFTDKKQINSDVTLSPSEERRIDEYLRNRCS